MPENGDRLHQTSDRIDMRRISAWLEVDNNSLPDHISSMLFWSENSASNWSLIAVTDSSDSSHIPFTLSSSRSTLVRFELPEEMKCILHDMPDQVVPLAYAADSREGDNGQFLRRVWVPTLPAIHAKEIFFADETSKKGFESNLKRLLPGRGEWLKLRVLEHQSHDAPSFEHESASPFDTRGNSGATRDEKLATAVATAVRLGRSNIGNDRTVTFNAGTVALLRQLLSHDPTVPDEKTLRRDAKILIKHLLQAARDHNLKPGTLPKKIPETRTGVLQLSHILQSTTDTSNKESSDQFSFLSASSGQLSETTESLDQSVLRHILQGLLEIDHFPTIDDIITTCKKAREKLESGPGIQHAESEIVLEALQSIIANVESPEDRIDRFRDRFGQLPGITGIAHVFWGWSGNPQENFEQRIAPLKAESRETHQIANIVFSATGGAGRLPVRYLRSRLWMAAYESAWEFLLSSTVTDDHKVGDQELWSSEKGGLTLTESGPFVKIRIGNGKIPLGLQIADRLLSVQTLALDLLRSEESVGKTANAILAATDGDISNFSKDLKNLVEMTLIVRLAKSLNGEITGSSITFRNVKENDLTFEHRWSDPVAAGRKLLQGRTLVKILEGLSKPQLDSLGKQLTG